MVPATKTMQEYIYYRTPGELLTVGQLMKSLYFHQMPEDLEDDEKVTKKRARSKKRVKDDEVLVVFYSF